MLEKICLVAEEIARAAGEDILLKHLYSAEKVVSYKSRTNLVTNADQESEKYICNRIADTFPEHSVIAEEGHRSDSQSEYVWLVDPLDATNNYAHGIPHFCVSIGVYSRRLEQTVAGVVYEPVKKELFSAIKGQGAWLNGSPIHVSETSDIGYALIATGFPYDKENPDINNLIQLNACLPYTQDVRRMGSAALDLCYCACARLDAYWEPMLYPWDVAAGSLILEEAGGKTSDYCGGRFSPFLPEIVASNGHVHDQLQRIIFESTKVLPRELASRQLL